MALGEVRAKLTVDTASFDPKMQKSGEVATATGRAVEQASARARAAWEKELVAQDRLAQKLEQVARQKQLAALQADILARSTESAARGAEELGHSFDEAGHAAVSQMQAASASIRLVEGGMTNNIRAVERFISTLPGVGAALQTIFPLVGGLAFVGLLVKMGSEVRKVVQDAQELPKRLKDGFDELNAASQSSNDALDITNDKLEIQLAKLEKKPGNELQLALDQARKSADDLASSLSKDIAKVNDLLAKNQVGFLGKLMGQAGTENSTKIVTDTNAELAKINNSYQETIDDAVGRGASQQNIVDIKTAQMAKLQEVYKNAEAKIRPILHSMQQDMDMFNESGGGRGRNESGNIAILGGFLQSMRNQQQQIGGTLLQETTQAKVDSAEGKRQGTTTDNRAAEQRLKAMEAELNQQKLLRERSTKEDYDYWDARKYAFSVGSDQYNQIIAKQVALAEAGASKAHETITRFLAEAKSAAKAQDAANAGITRGAESIRRGAVADAGERNQGYIDSNQLELVRAHNEAHEQEAKIMDESGRSITRYAAALQLADVHAKEFAAEMSALQGNLNTRQLQAGLDPSKQNQKAVADAQAAIAEAQAKYTIQIQSDHDAANGRDSSGLVGAKDALDDFTKAARDSATQIQQLTTGTLQDFNRTLLDLVTTPRRGRGPHFVARQFEGLGRGVATNVASLGINKAEGALFGALGFGGGKLGTKGNPMSVVVENISAANTAAAAGGTLTDILSGGIKLPNVVPTGDSSASATPGAVSKIVSAALGLLPGFAAGGSIDANTMSIVGEKGPELFMPSTAGTVVPNNQLSNFGGHTFNVSVDASHSGDPAQVEAAAHRAVMAAAPHIINAGLQAQREQGLRSPMTRH